jgi:hypothetical protein
LVFQGHPLANQLLARDDQRAERMSLQRLHMHGLEEAGASQMRQTSRVVAIGLVGRKRLERMVGLPALHADHGQTEVAQPVEKGPAPCAQSRTRCDGNSALSTVRQRSPRPSMPSCSRERPRLRDRERKHASRPSKYRGQQNSPSFGLLFHIRADRIGLRRRAPDHYPMLKKSLAAVRRC